MALADRQAPSPYDFSFFASGGPKFESVGFVDDELVGAEVNSGGDRNLRTYDGFVLHGRFPTSYETLDFERHLGADRYSQGVRALARQDWREGYKSWRMALSLHERYAKPVLAVSRNVFSSERAGAGRERAEADALMARLLTPLRFVPLPDALFEEDGQVRRRFYTSYVNVHGRQGSASSHDEWHYNREAGGLILDSLLERLDAAFAKG
jgi:hypothetical protein